MNDAKDIREKQIPVKITKEQNKYWKEWRFKSILKNVALVILGLWIIFSAGYIVRDLWMKFQFQQAQTVYQKGVADTIRAVMGQTESCKSVFLNDGDKKIELIKTGCDAETKSSDAKQKLPLGQDQSAGQEQPTITQTPEQP